MEPADCSVFAPNRLSRSSWSSGSGCKCKESSLGPGALPAPATLKFCVTRPSRPRVQCSQAYDHLSAFPPSSRQPATTNVRPTWPLYLPKWRRPRRPSLRFNKEVKPSCQRLISPCALIPHIPTKLARSFPYSQSRHRRRSRSLDLTQSRKGCTGVRTAFTYSLGHVNEILVQARLSETDRRAVLQRGLDLPLVQLSLTSHRLPTRISRMSHS